MLRAARAPRVDVEDAVKILAYPPPWPHHSRAYLAFRILFLVYTVRVEAWFAVGLTLGLVGLDYLLTHRRRARAEAARLAALRTALMEQLYGPREDR